MAVTSQIKQIFGKPNLFNMGIVKFYKLKRKGGENVRIAYVRVSTQEQNLDRQPELLKPYGIEKFFQEKQSGKDMGREKLNELLEFVREGDEVYVESWSRLSRTVRDLLKQSMSWRNLHIKTKIPISTLQYRCRRYHKNSTSEEEQEA